MFIASKQKTTEIMFNSLLNFVSRRKFHGARVTTIDDTDLSSEDNIIALMGPTGTGKSSFIEIATGKSGLAGHSLESCTENISIIRFTFPEIVDSDICFVDTPGFDDTKGNDEKTFKAISNFIIYTHKRKLKLTGLLYFHRISDNRMGGSLLKNLKYFEELCENEFKKIIFITTMWDQTDKGEKYERELKESYWRPILDMGSSTRRFLYERSSAFDVLSPYFDEINRKSFRRLQDEVQDVALKLHRLMDGKSLSVELERAISCRQKTLQRIRAELRKPSLNEIEIRELMDSYEKEFEKLSRVATELKTLGIETGKHFKRVVWRMNWDEVIGVYSPERTSTQIPLVVQEEGVSLALERTELELQSVGSDALSEVDTRDQPEEAAGQIDSRSDFGSERSSSNSDKAAVSPRITLGGDMVEEESPELWENDDQPSDEDQEEVTDSEGDEIMQEQESRVVVDDSVYTKPWAGDRGRPYEFDNESDLWEEFEVWKEEEERNEYERWYERRKEYKEFERWTDYEQLDGEWDDREEWSDFSKSGKGDDENDRYDDWSLFEEFQENEQRRKFNWLVEQETNWMVFKHETYLDSD